MHKELKKLSKKQMTQSINGLVKVRQLSKDEVQKVKKH